MSRGFFIVLLLCVLLPVAALAVRQSGLLQAPPAPAPASTPTARSVATKVPRPTDQTAADQTPTLPPVATDQSSWEAPFRTNLWTHSGWDFSPQGMRNSGSQRAWATFARPYAQLMLECAWQIPQAAEPDFEIVLSPAATRHQIRIHLSENSIRLLRQTGETATVLKARPCQPTARTTDIRTLRLIITGTRLLIHWQGRIWITAEQPAELQGQTFHWTLASATPQFRLTTLRVEGE